MNSFYSLVEAIDKNKSRVAIMRYRNIVLIEGFIAAIYYVANCSNTTNHCSNYSEPFIGTIISRYISHVLFILFAMSGGSGHESRLNNSDKFMKNPIKM